MRLTYSPAVEDGTAQSQSDGGQVPVLPLFRGVEDVLQPLTEQDVEWFFAHTLILTRDYGFRTTRRSA
jgi:hypothetical protein